MLTEEQYLNVMEGWIDYLNKPEHADELNYYKTCEEEAFNKIEQKILERKTKRHEEEL